MDIAEDFPKRKTTTSTMLKWAVNKPLSVEPTMAIFVDDAQHTPTSRRSLGTNLGQCRARDPVRDLRRKTLGANAAVSRHQRRQNKENHIMVTPHPITMRQSPVTSNPLHKTELAFREIGNLTPTPNDNSFNQTPVQKRHLPPSPSPRTRNPVLTKSFASTLPTLDVEYSPACGLKSGPAIALRGITVATNFFGNARYFQDEQLQSVAKRPKLTPEVTPVANLQFGNINLGRAPMFKNHMEEEDDLNMSSKALDDKQLNQMIDDILQSSRKVNKQILPKFMPAKPETIEEVSYCDVPSSTTNDNSDNILMSHKAQSLPESQVGTADSTSDECQLRRQRAVRRKATQSSKPSLASCESPEFPDDLEPSQIEMLACMNTPKPIRGDESEPISYRCAVNSITSKQSCESTPGIEEKDVQGSSTPTETQQSIRRCLRFPDSPDSMEDSLEKRKSVASSTASTTSSRCSKNSAHVAGSLDLCISSDDRQIKVHVIRCKDLFRSNGGPVNAYVKVAMIPSLPSNDNGFQRTAVQRNSIKPCFDHRFNFEQTPTDPDQRVQLSVWHRDREFKRSEFLGCMSFPLHAFYKKEIAGTYKLQPQSGLSTPTAAILIENFQSSIEESESSPMTHEPNQSHSCLLSQKALQQRDADENLFLRFLEIDTNIQEAGLPHNHFGRTPFTLSKQLTRHSEHGFGLSIVWTHPPRIERIEPGQAADQAGLVPGDFLIFVDKQNVVTMPEADILNQIRAQGDVLRLEVFRQSTQAIQHFGVMNSDERKRGQPDLGQYGHTEICAGDLQAKKRPRIAFSQDVGSGIIV